MKTSFRVWEPEIRPRLLWRRDLF